MRMDMHMLRDKWRKAVIMPREDQDVQNAMRILTPLTHRVWIRP